ncbi:hypothetical protein BOSEA31B_12489 [Hyphomicrobiales bacterium]|nr:hypothetical protein BOSEA31B_12489 [Hyphomicrobiales bacterium]CAH1698267.1 hypothetical protein BOSEA1005_11313 [Hyphomicrobiales bacterium]CAI0341933.1 hypothetical protein BO1005MUT1_100023 [Hyphomicrobiales bacterium]
MAGSSSRPNSLEKKPRFFGSVSLIAILSSVRRDLWLRRRAGFASAMPWLSRTDQKIRKHRGRSRPSCRCRCFIATP